MFSVQWRTLELWQILMYHMFSTTECSLNSGEHMTNFDLLYDLYSRMFSELVENIWKVQTTFFPTAKNKRNFLLSRRFCIHHVIDYHLIGFRQIENCWYLSSVRTRLHCENSDIFHLKLHYVWCWRVSTHFYLHHFQNIKIYTVIVSTLK